MLSYPALPYEENIPAEVQQWLYTKVQRPSPASFIEPLKTEFDTKQRDASLNQWELDLSQREQHLNQWDFHHNQREQNLNQWDFDLGQREYQYQQKLRPRGSHARVINPDGEVPAFDPDWREAAGVDASVLTGVKSRHKLDVMISYGVLKIGDILTVGSMINGQGVTQIAEVLVHLPRQIGPPDILAGR